MIDTPPEPDRFEKVLRFICGAVFGFFVVGISVLKFPPDHLWVGWCIVGGGTLVLGYLAMRWGDEFWRGVADTFRVW